MGIREIGKSGAELAWQFFFKTPEPDFVRLVGDYDTFRAYGTSKFDTKVLPFLFGSELYMDGLDPRNHDSESYLFNLEKLDELISKFLHCGEIIFRYKKLNMAKINHGHAFVRQLWGYRVLCLNTCENGSLALTLPGTYDPKEHDMMCCFCFDGQKWGYGFYTNDHPEVDCSAIAKQYGGGGHRGAAGCVVEQPIFDLGRSSM